MHVRTERLFAVLCLIAVVIVSGCDPSAGPTSGLNDGANFKTSESEAAFGKKPQPQLIDPVNDIVHEVGDLIAGQHTVVGKVEVDLNGTLLTVTYTTDPGWCMTETHVYVGQNQPSTSAPGQFPYGNDTLSCVSSWGTGAIDVSSLTGTIWIAAHAVVNGGDVDGLIEASWSGLVNVTYSRESEWTMETYFAVIVGNWGALSGTYQGWCADADTHADLDFVYDAHAYSTYDPSFPSGLVERPENLDLVNYILNQNYVGSISPLYSPEVYTYGDVQRAIWTLLEPFGDTITDEGLGPYSQDRVDEILADAGANGENFVPSCGQVYGVIFQPVDQYDQTVAQPALIPLPVRCGGGEETAWGQGYVGGAATGIYQFGTGWGWYFPYDLPF